MLRQSQQQVTAQLLRTAIKNYCGGNEPLSALTRILDRNLGRQRPLKVDLSNITMNQVRLIHQVYEEERHGTPVLGQSLLDRLQLRFGGNLQQTKNEVEGFLKLGAACLHLQDDIQPVQLLGANISVPAMPRRVLLLGLPQHPFTNTIVQAFNVAVPAGANYVFSTYIHDDPTQIRLLLIDYWFAARFSSIISNL
ncbi:hypothetical protein TI04_13435, partial [Achromatium sp. WMS2]